MYRNKSTTAQWKAWRQTGSHANLIISLLILFSFSMSLKATKAKSPLTLPFPFGYFCLMLFTSRLCDVTPVVCQTEGRRCLMQPASLFFFSSRLFFTGLYFYFICKWSPPTQCCDTAFLSLGWQCRSQGISLFSFSLSLSLCYMHAHSLLLPTSSIITPPSIQDTAESWCCQPEPDALSHSHMRHLSGPAPPPCCSLSSTYTSLARVTGSGLFWRVGGDEVLFKAKETLTFLWCRGSQVTPGASTPSHTSMLNHSKTLEMRL